jgi:hypothetical protein
MKAIEVLYLGCLKNTIPVTVENCAFGRVEKRNSQPRALYNDELRSLHENTFSPPNMKIYFQVRL